jgi:hypothetical protein
MNHILFKLSDALLSEKFKIPVDLVDVEKLFGQIVANRIAGIAYNNIDFSDVSNDVEKALYCLYQSAKDRTKSFKSNLRYLATILHSADFNYSLLKGAFLTTALYPEGYRTSNDIDILIEEHNISRLQNLLVSAGFVQGSSNRNGEIIPAPRREIVMSRMNYGETIPFVKEVEGSVLEVDINFSLDYKPELDSQIVIGFLTNRDLITIDECEFYTLNKVDFLIHLCCHLYKEATTSDWVRRRRDLMLYKFSDINVYLHKFGSVDYFNAMIKRAKQCSLEGACYYTLVNSLEIYPKLAEIDGYAFALNAIRPDDLRFMKQVVFPLEKRVMQYDMTFTEWFFCENRMANLVDVK